MGEIKKKKDEAVSLIKAEGDNGTNENVKDLQEGLDAQSRVAFLRAREYQELIEMRKGWSINVLRLLVFIIVADMGFIYLLGWGVLDFKNEYIVPAFIGEGVLKTLGLAFIIVRFLFSKDSMRRDEKE